MLVIVNHILLFFLPIQTISVVNILHSVYLICDFCRTCSTCSIQVFNLTFLNLFEFFNLKYSFFWQPCLLFLFTFYLLTYTIWKSCIIFNEILLSLNLSSLFTLIDIPDPSHLRLFVFLLLLFWNFWLELRANSSLNRVFFVVSTEHLCIYIYITLKLYLGVLCNRSMYTAISCLFTQYNSSIYNTSIIPSYTLLYLHL